MVEELFLTYAETKKIEVYRDWIEDPTQTVLAKSKQSGMTRTTYQRRIQEVKKDLLDEFGYQCQSQVQPPTVLEYSNRLILNSFPFQVIMEALNEKKSDLEELLNEHGVSRSTMYRKMKPLFAIMKYLGLRLSFEEGVQIIGPEITIRLFYIVLLGKIASNDVARAIELKTFNPIAHEKIKRVMRMDENLFESLNFEIGYRMVMKRYENNHFFTPTAELVNFYDTCLCEHTALCTDFLPNKGRRSDEAIYFQWISEFSRYRKAVIYEDMDFDSFFHFKEKQTRLHAKYLEVMRMERQFFKFLSKNKKIIEGYMFSEHDIRENLKKFFTLVYLFGNEKTVNPASFDYLLRDVRDDNVIEDVTREFVTMQKEEIQRIFRVCPYSFGSRLMRVLAHYLEPYKGKNKVIYCIGIDITPSHPLTVRIAQLLKAERDVIFEQFKDDEDYDLVISYSSRLGEPNRCRKELNLFGLEKQVEKHLFKVLGHLRGI